MDVREVFTYPMKDTEWSIKIIIGVALSILPIVNFFCAGYAYRIFKATLNREAPTMPQWGEWGDTFIQGLIIFVIRFIYYLIPLIFLGTGSVFLITAFVLREKTGVLPSGMILPGVVLIGVGLILSVVAAVLFPMALAVYAKNNERFGAAFRLWEIGQNILAVLDDYFIAIVLLFCVFFAYFVLSAIPYLGILFAVLLAFYLKYLFYYALFGSACAGAFADNAAGLPPAGAR